MDINTSLYLKMFLSSISLPISMPSMGDREREREGEREREMSNLLLCICSYIVNFGVVLVFSVLYSSISFVCSALLCSVFVSA